MNLQESIHCTHSIEREHIISAFEACPELSRRAERLKDCASHGKLYLEGTPPNVRLWIYRCGDRLCPLCAKHRSRKVATQLMDVMIQRNVVRHIVLTIRTDPGDQLVDVLHHLRDSFRKLRRTKEWKAHVSGGAYVVEITRNQKTGGWHPHIHILAAGIYFPQSLLSALWMDASDGSTNVYVSAAHGKHANHLAKYAAKPPRLETWPASAIAEYAQVTNAVRMVQCFGDFHPEKLEDADRNPEPAATRSCITLSVLRSQAAAGHPAAVAMVRAVASRWPRLWQFLRTAIDLPPPISLADHRKDLDRAQEAVDHTAKFIIPLTTPVSTK